MTEVVFEGKDVDYGIAVVQISPMKQAVSSYRRPM